jgi:hypothetical protein
MSDVAAVVAAAASSRGIGAGGDLVCVFLSFQEMFYVRLFLFPTVLTVESFFHCKGVAFAR